MRHTFGVMTAAMLLVGCTAYMPIDPLLTSAALLTPAGTATPRIDLVPDGPTPDATKSVGPPQVSTYAGSVSGTQNGTLSTATFAYPHDLVKNATGDIFVSEPGSQLIRRIDPAGNVTTFVGNGHAINAPGTGTGASIYAPLGLAIDSKGNLFASSAAGHTILAITPSGGVSIFAGGPIPGHADGQGTAASFRSPYGLCIDAQDNLYVADKGNHRIRKITPAGVVSTVAGSSAGYLDANGTSAQFDAPYGIALDAAGNLLVSDGKNKRIRKIAPDGTVTTLAGTGATGSEDGLASSATFEDPTSLSFAPDGALYVSDVSRLRRIKDGQVTTVAGSEAGFAEGLAPQAQFKVLYGSLFLSAETLLVADMRNFRIRRLDFSASP